MPIDTSIADMSWLLQPANPGASFAQGVTAGSRIAQNYLQGVGLAQRQMEAEQELNMRQRQLAMKLAQAPLRQTILQQNSQLNALRLEQGLRDKQNYLKATEAFNGLAERVSPLLEDGQIDEAQSVLMQEGANNAFLLNDPRFKGLYDFTTKAQDAKLELLRARTSTANPELMTLTDPKTGKEFPVVHQPGSRVFQVLDPEKDALAKKALELREQKLQQALPEATKQEVRSLYKQIDRKREQLDDTTTLPEMTGLPWNKQPNPKRAKLKAEIDALEEQVKRLTAVPAPAPAPVTAPAPATVAPPQQFKLGGTYQHPNGKRYIYKGGDATDPESWQEIP